MLLFFCENIWFKLCCSLIFLGKSGCAKRLLQQMFSLCVTFYSLFGQNLKLSVWRFTQLCLAQKILHDLHSNASLIGICRFKMLQTHHRLKRHKNAIGCHNNKGFKSQHMTGQGDFTENIQT